MFPCTRVLAVYLLVHQRRFLCLVLLWLSLSAIVAVLNSRSRPVRFRKTLTLTFSLVRRGRVQILPRSLAPVRTSSQRNRSRHTQGKLVITPREIRAADEKENARIVRVQDRGKLDCRRSDLSQLAAGESS